MSLIEKFVIMFEVDAGQLASNLDAAENKVKDFVMAAQAAAQVDFSQMAKLPTTVDMAVDAIQKMDANLVNLVDQSASFNQAFNDAKKQIDDLKQGTSDLGNQLKTTTKNLDQGLQKTDDRLSKIEKEIGKVKEQFKSTKTQAIEFKLTLEKAKEVAGELGKQLKNAFSSLSKPLTDVLSVSSMIASGFERIDEVANLDKAAKQSRIAVGDLDALGRAAKSLGGDVQAAGTDIQTIADNALEAVSNKGSDAAKAFNAFGINLKNEKGALKDTNNLLLELADASSKMSAGEAKNKLKSLGFVDPGMIKLIMSGKKAVLEHVDAQKQASHITKAQAKTAQKYKDAQEEFATATKNVSGELLTLLLPALTGIMGGIKQFITFCKENKRIVITFFGAIGVAVGAYALVAGSAAIATNAFLWPILAIVAACAFLAFAFDEVSAYLNDQPSLLGALANKYEWFGSILDSIGAVCGALKTAFLTFWGVVENLGAAFKALFSGDFSGFATHMKAVFDKITGFWKEMWNGFTGIVGTIVEVIKDKLWDMLPGWAKRWLGLDDKKKAEAQQEIEELDNANVSRDILPGHTATDLRTVKPMLSAIIQTATTPIPANANQKIDIKKDTSVQVNAPITINNTVDTQEAIEAAAKAAQGIIAREMNKAISNSDNAVAR